MFVKWFVFFKQKTAYEMRSSDWSSDVCSSDLRERPRLALGPQRVGIVLHARTRAEHEMAAAADIGFEMLRLRLGHDVEIGRDHERISREISLGREHMDALRQIGRAHV